MGSSQNNSQRLLDRIDAPTDLAGLTSVELVDLSGEIRDHLINSVSKTGGHLGPNLGVVELTLALHRVFDSPKDTILWDTGHQSYVHKLVTGRKDFSALRKEGGLSGYPSRVESDHDVIENSHASTALSWADGIALAKQQSGDDSWTVAVVGDGALTGGMAWEALNSIAAGPNVPLVIVVNDNGRSYAPTVGGLAHHLQGLRTSDKYEETLARGKRALLGMGEIGERTYDALHGLKTGLKDVLAPQAMFADLGIKYLGPVDGHDLISLELALEHAKAYRAPILVHVITEKGRGYTPAEEDLADRFHAVGQIHPETGLPVAQSRFGWTAVCAEELLQAAEEDPKILGITAAMMAPVGLQPLADAFPDRVVDVGIAEQHAFTLAAGLGYGGAHPVVCVYATFMNRAFDQLLMDVSLHKAPVTIVLDRAGLTGDDGASHNGMWDLSLAAMVPGLKVFAPRDEATLRKGLREALAWQKGPTLVRYPKGEPPSGLKALRHEGHLDILFESQSLRAVTNGPETGEPESSGGATAPKTLIVSVGALATNALEAAAELAEEGHAVTVVDPGWVLPIPENLVDLAAGYDVVLSVEDGLASGGVGSELARLVALAGGPAVQVLGVQKRFLEHKPRASLLKESGLDAKGIAAGARAALDRL